MSFRSRNALSSKTIIRISICMGLIVGLVGCATTSYRPDLDEAIRQQEDATLDRLSHSNSSDIANQAVALRVPR